MQGSGNRQIIASNLRLDQPTTLPDGSPARNNCVARVIFLPPHVTPAELVRSVARMGPIGRILDTRLMAPSTREVGHAAFFEFDNDASARRFALLAQQNHFIVLGKAIWHCQIMAPIKEAWSRPLPPDVTRVLVIEGPRDHKMMNADALGEFLKSTVLGKSSDRQLLISGGSLGSLQDSCIARDSTKGPNSVTIEWAFTSWRRGANVARAALNEYYPELRVTYGRDPCD